MTGNTPIVNSFDKYISINYSSLKTSAQQIFWNDSDFEDHLQSNLVKIRDRITKSGYTGNNFGGYIFLTNSNSYKLKKKRESRNTFIDYESPDVENAIQKYYDDEDHDSQQYQDDLKIIIKCMFEYLGKYYSAQNVSLFKSYYLTNKNTYDSLATDSKKSYGTIKNIISTIKKDLRANLMNYTLYQCQEEVWRPVRGYDRYCVSNKGRVRNKQNTILKADYMDIYGVWKQNKRKYKSIAQLQEGVFRSEDCISFNRIII